MEESRRARRDSIGLRLRLAATIATVMLLISVVIGGVFVAASQSSQDALERSNLRSAAYAAQQLSSLSTESSPVPNQLSYLKHSLGGALSRMCQIFHIGVATLPSYEVNGSTTLQPTPTFELGSLAPPQVQSTGYQLGFQSGYATQALLAGSSKSFICGGITSLPRPTNLSLISPIASKGGKSQYDLVIFGTQETYFEALVDSDAALVISILMLLLSTITGIVLAVRQIRKATLGLTPTQLASVLEEQQALLQGISEGVIGCDQKGRIRFFNAEAQRILRLPKSSAGRPIGVLVRGSRLRGVLTGEIQGRDLPVVVGESVLIINRIVVESQGDELGYVITLRDQTEWEGLLKELDSLVGMTETLRAQAHEFRNKLHIIIGLIEIDRPEEAVAFAREVSVAQSRFSSRLAEEIADPMVEALLLAKSASAAERAVDLVVDEESRLNARLNNPAEVLSILGNLIDNGIDAASNEVLQLGWETGDRGWVRVGLRNEGTELHIEVSDSGSGISPEIREDIFTDGFSTKVSRHGARRGLGLALVRQVVSRAAGTIEVTNNPGALFKITIPSAVGEIEHPIARLRRSMASESTRN